MVGIFSFSLSIHDKLVKKQPVSVMHGNSML